MAGSSSNSHLAIAEGLLGPSIVWQQLEGKQ